MVAGSVMMRLNDIANTVDNIVAHDLHEEHKCVIKLAKCLCEKGSVFLQDNGMQVSIRKQRRYVARQVGAGAA